MPSKHGNRMRLQILLESNRGQLLIEHAEEKGMRASELIRDIVYKYIQQHVGNDQYSDALRKDVQMWNESVESRLSRSSDTH